MPLSNSYNNTLGMLFPILCIALILFFSTSSTATISTSLDSPPALIPKADDQLFGIFEVVNNDEVPHIPWLRHFNLRLGLPTVLIDHEVGFEIIEDKTVLQPRGQKDVPLSCFIGLESPIPGNIEPMGLMTVDFSKRPILPDQTISFSCIFPRQAAFDLFYLDYNIRGDKLTHMSASYTITNDQGDKKELKNIFALPIAREKVAEGISFFLLPHLDDASREPLFNMRNFYIKLIHPLRQLSSSITLHFSLPILRSERPEVTCIVFSTTFLGEVVDENTLLLKITQPFGKSDTEPIIQCNTWLDFNSYPATASTLTIITTSNPTTLEDIKLPDIDDSGEQLPKYGPFCGQFGVDLYKIYQNEQQLLLGNNNNNINKPSLELSNMDYTSSDKVQIPNKRGFRFALTNIQFPISDIKQQNLIVFYTPVPAFVLIDPTVQKPQCLVSDLTGSVKDEWVNLTLNENKESFTLVIRLFHEKGSSLLVDCQSSLLIDVSSNMDSYIPLTVSYVAYSQTASFATILPIQDVIPSKSLFESTSLNLWHHKDDQELLWARDWSIDFTNALYIIDKKVKLFVNETILVTLEDKDHVNCFLTIDSQEQKALPFVDKSTSMNSLIFDFTAEPIPKGSTGTITCSPSLFFFWLSSRNLEGDFRGDKLLTLTLLDDFTHGHNIVIPSINDGSNVFDWLYDIMVPIRTQYQSQLYILLSHLPTAEIETKEVEFNFEMIISGGRFVQPSSIADDHTDTSFNEPIPLLNLHYALISVTVPGSMEPTSIFIPLTITASGVMTPFVISLPTHWSSFSIEFSFTTFNTDPLMTINPTLTGLSLRNVYHSSPSTKTEWRYSQEPFEKGFKLGKEHWVETPVFNNSVSSFQLPQSFTSHDDDDDDDMNEYLGDIDNDTYIVYDEDSPENSDVIKEKSDLTLINPTTLLPSNQSNELYNNDLSFQLNQQPDLFITVQNQKNETVILPTLDLTFTKTKVPILSLSLLTNATQSTKTRDYPSFWFDYTAFPNTFTFNCTVEPFGVSIEAHLARFYQSIDFDLSPLPKLMTPGSTFRILCPDIGIPHYSTKNPFVSMTLFGWYLPKTTQHLNNIDHMVSSAQQQQQYIRFSSSPHGLMRGLTKSYNHNRNYDNINALQQPNLSIFHHNGNDNNNNNNNIKNNSNNDSHLTTSSIPLEFFSMTTTFLMAEYKPSHKSKWVRTLVSTLVSIAGAAALTFLAIFLWRRYRVRKRGEYIGLDEYDSDGNYIPPEPTRFSTQ